MKRIFAFLAAALLAACLLAPAASAETYADYDTNYITKRFDTEVVLQEDNVYRVTERIEVDFLQRSHGIYRYIPYVGSLEYMEDGEVRTRRYRASIENISVEGTSYSTSSEDGNLLLKIGDKDVLVSGEQSYVIHYDIRMKEDGIPGCDIIGVNVLPHGWRTDVGLASFTVSLPKPVAEGNLKLYGGRYGSTGEPRFSVELESDGGGVVRVRGTSEGTLNAFEGATLYAQVEEGYFVGEADNTLPLALLWILLIASPVAVVLLYLLFGRDEPIIPVQTVRPPKDMTSAEVGYIMDSAVDQRDLLSLIIYWAGKGFLSIREESEGKLWLQKQNELPNDAKPYEKSLFQGIFHDGDDVAADSLGEDFRNAFQLARTQLSGSFSARKGRSLHTKASIAGEVTAFLLALVTAGVGFFVSLYLEVLSPLWLIVGIGAMLVLTAGYFGITYLAQHWYVMNQRKRTGAILGILLGVVLGWGAMIIISLFQMYNPLPVLVAGASSLICVLLAAVLPKRTTQCNEWMGELLGLKEFIEVAEKERLEALVEEDPAYFYDVLPFAYVMGISDVWSKRFESIPLEPPTWFYGDFHMNIFTTYYLLHAFNNCTESLSASLVPPASSSSGGFGSGGGFSGGGVGGGGGGSW